MPSPQFKKVKAGDPISAAEWNRMVMALERVGNILSFSGIDIFSGTGFMSARIHLDQYLFIGKLDAQLTDGSSADAVIWKSLPGSSSSESASNLKVTAYDWMLASGDTLASGTKVVLLKHPSSGKYYVIAAACQ